MTEAEKIALAMGTVERPMTDEELDKARAEEAAQDRASALEPGECDCDVRDKSEIEAAERRGIERVQKALETAKVVS